MGTGFRREGDVVVFQMDAEENRFDPAMIDDWNAVLDEIEKTEGPCALVTTGTGKFYSNGLDLDYGMGSGDMPGYVQNVIALYARVLTLPCITVAAMNGHAFGAGGQIALAHDFRVMRGDRGYFCMPEIDMGAPLHPGMTAILQERLPKQTCLEVIATGRRFGGEDAVAAGIAQEARPDAEVLQAAIDRAASLTDKAKPAMRALKTGMVQPILDALERPLAL
jgi:enoyl-CoA hydratase/carnithine racemase